MYYLSYQWILNTWRKPSCLLEFWQPLARHYSPPRKSFEPFLITAGLLPNKSQVFTLKSFNTICFVLERVGISSKIEMKLLLFFWWKKRLVVNVYKHRPLHTYYFHGQNELFGNNHFNLTFPELLVTKPVATTDEMNESPRFLGHDCPGVWRRLWYKPDF